MSITKSIGKNTLGGGKKMNVDLKTYNRSTHNVGYVWRNTQSPGTLVPFMCELSTANETWEIDLTHNIMTHPTVGPLFGSFKFQADVFTCPIRLYNAMLHNNALNVGLNMAQVKFPKIEVNIGRDSSTNENEEFSQINPSCLLSYLGIKGYGKVIKNTTTNANVRKNFTSTIAYYDIFKNYYANKQEEDFYIITKNQDINVYVADDMGGVNAGKEITANSAYIGILKEDAVSVVDFQNKTRILVGRGNQYGGYIWYRTRDLIEGEVIYNSWNIDGENKEMIIFKLTEKGELNNPVTLQNAVLETETGISKFKLEIIDNVRDDILSRGKGEFIVSNSYDFKYLQQLASRTNANGKYAPGVIDASMPWRGKQNYSNLNTTNNQFGLALKTYQSDMFNNWVNTDWIDGDNGINKITAVKIDPESNSFQLDTLNLAQKVYNMLNRIAVSGGTYQDWLETVYTGQYTNRSETPVYEGGMSTIVDFQEVISQSETADSPLGSLAGRGITRGQKGGHLVIKVDEPSYIIGICSLTPIVDYCQGNRFDTELDSLDDLHKPALDAIGFQDRIASTMDWRATTWEEGVRHDFSIGKQPAWIEYMTNVNKTFGNFALKDNEAFMVLNRWYETIYQNNYMDASTYIDPRKYNYIFADTSIDAMNFWVQIGLDIKRREPISAKVIPNM